MNPSSVQVSSPSFDPHYRDFFDRGISSVALIGPDKRRGDAIVRAIAESHGGEFRWFSSYPPTLDDLPGLLGEQYNVILIDLDSNTEYALELVERISDNGAATVAVFSEQSDPELVFRAMRSGAREFLCLPLTQDAMAEALVRAAARRPATAQKKGGGRLLVFFGAKGGSGVTTIASNFAAALSLDARQSTLLIDLDLPFGDAAFRLGLAADYSTVNALQNATRLDAGLLSKLVVKHHSGLSVLAAPGRFPDFQPRSNPIEKVDYPQYRPSDESIQRLVTVARRSYDNVVVDAGSKLDYVETAVFKDAKTIYLVAQPEASQLRTANHLIGQFFGRGGPKLEIVINRLPQRALGADGGQIAKALVRPPQWEIPNDDAAVRHMEKTAIPLAVEDFPISRSIRHMAGSILGQPLSPEKKKRFGFLGLLKASNGKNDATGEQAADAPFVPTEAAAMRPEVKASAAEPFVYSPPAQPIGTAGLPPLRQQPAPAAAMDEIRIPDAGREKTPGAVPANWQDKFEAHSIHAVASASETSSHPSPLPREKHKAAQETPAPAKPAAIPTTSGLGGTQRNAAASVWTRPVSAPAAGQTPPLPLSHLPELAPQEPAKSAIAPAVTADVTPDITPARAAEAKPAEVPIQVAIAKPVEAPATVVRVTPAISWPAPEPIAYGTALGDAQFNATASVPGTFVYSPAAGAVPAVGRQLLTALFTPDDTAKYSTAHSIVTLEVQAPIGLELPVAEELPSASAASAKSEPEARPFRFAGEGNRADGHAALWRPALPLQKQTEDSIPATLPLGFAGWDFEYPPETVSDGLEAVAGAPGSDTGLPAPETPIAAQSATDGKGWLSRIRAFRGTAKTRTQAGELSEAAQSEHEKALRRPLAV